jgi:hypothetical protein
MSTLIDALNRSEDSMASGYYISDEAPSEFLELLVTPDEGGTWAVRVFDERGDMVAENTAITLHEVLSDWQNVHWTPITAAMLEIYGMVQDIEQDIEQDIGDETDIQNEGGIDNNGAS